MNKYAVNYNSLNETMQPKPKVFKYENVKHRLVKVAFDVVRFVDGDDVSGLWQVNQTDDGEYIVAQYNDYVVEEAEKTASNWSAYPDEGGDHIHLFYKNDPVTKIATASVGVSNDEAPMVASILPERLDTNTILAKGLLMELSHDSRAALLKSHPELHSIAEDSLVSHPCGCKVSDSCECNGSSTKETCKCK